MQFAVNRVSMFKGAGWGQAFSAMRTHGFNHYEMWQLADAELPEAVREAARHGMSLCGMCPDDFGLNDPENHPAYRAAIERALPRLLALSGTHLITQAGKNNGRPLEDQLRATADGLRLVAPLMEVAQKTLVIEPLNTVIDHPDTWLDSSDLAAAIIRDVGSERVKMLYDAYHMLHMGEDVLAQIERHIELIDYVHIAGFPGRNQDLQTGFDMRALLKRLRALGYDGVVGFEFWIDPGEDADTVLDRLFSLIQEV